ncbi:MAG: IgA Peptidase M64 [Ignavibacteriales bacterium]|nr:IgA Peptidase M64 [Ignavibacteriales bacterium]
MFRSILYLILFIPAVYTSADFTSLFKNNSMRFEYYETGNFNNSTISAGKLFREEKWFGRQLSTEDNFKYGNYRFEIIDSVSGQIIYSQGFSTLFFEWQNTEEAKSIYRTFEGFIRFPEPVNPFELKIFKRNEKLELTEKFLIKVNPNSIYIEPSGKNDYTLLDIVTTKDSLTYDILFIPEGYTKDQLPDFISDCNKFSGFLFKYEPFKELKEQIAIRALLVPSQESGTDNPGNSTFKNTVLGSSFYTFGSERYLMTTDYFTIGRLSSGFPADKIVILVNTEKYGGGGIYNFYSIFAARNQYAEKVFIHELGHGIAGLADEYFGDEVAFPELYPEGIEPWEINITRLIDFKNKWEKYIDPATPIPTPVSEDTKEINGVFEGGGYAVKGIYRSTFNSVMRSLSSASYNPVSSEAIKQIILFTAH